jgi:hypothetical protein
MEDTFLDLSNCINNQNQRLIVLERSLQEQIQNIHQLQRDNSYKFQRLEVIVGKDKFIAYDIKHKIDIFQSQLQEGHLVNTMSKVQLNEYIDKLKFHISPYDLEELEEEQHKTIPNHDRFQIFN